MWLAGLNEDLDGEDALAIRGLGVADYGAVPLGTEDVGAVTRRGHVGIFDGCDAWSVADVLAEAAPLDLDAVGQSGVVQLVLARQLVGPGLRLGLSIPVDVQRRQLVGPSIGVELGQDELLRWSQAGSQ